MGEYGNGEGRGGYGVGDEEKKKEGPDGSVGGVEEGVSKVGLGEGEEGGEVLGTVGG